jgi:hypothetical protein
MKTTYITFTNPDNTETIFAVTDDGNGNCVVMTKAHYEELEAAKEVKADGK